MWVWILQALLNAFFVAAVLSFLINRRKLRALERKIQEFEMSLDRLSRLNSEDLDFSEPKVSFSQKAPTQKTRSEEKGSEQKLAEMRTSLDGEALAGEAIASSLRDSSIDFSKSTGGSSRNDGGLVSEERSAYGLPKANFGGAGIGNEGQYREAMKLFSSGLSVKEVSRQTGLSASELALIEKLVLRGGRPAGLS